MSVPSEILNVNPSPSTSLPATLMLPGVSSSNAIFEMVLSTGASFTGVTVSVIVSVSESSPSNTVIVKDSLPLKSWVGINVKSLPDKLAVTWSPPEILYVN